MCTSPPCPHGCRQVSGSGRQKQQHMFRTYIRVYDNNRKQHAAPVGWWCPGCHLFVNDSR
ncbi:MAG: hypothetical protein A4E35_01974 [Methanoregula sp. PtaU1.Bin051]|nr:MAG: hypothetical protein A4E35_01974 [Methanoregula sp. PtaU1.Bin051]